MFVKRIFSVVGETIFYMFLDQTKKDKLSMGQALAVLATAYARGRIDLNQWPALIEAARFEERERKRLAEAEASAEEKIYNEALDPNQ